ncbi:PD-(D/E)XK nuclease family protein [Treponema sp. HNW]|uniref:PD-(D/E)XK nuclease family protein n=1 Tax=Treponema sp. HNW TaxID=3116654 RepID=UPI003D0BDAF1
MQTVETVLKEHIGDASVFFVFPTDIAASCWADYALRFTEALALERFTAWDRFKSEAVRAVHQDKKSIPAVLRRLFALQLLESNAQKPFFSSLIPQTYAASASGFADWLASLLPQLALWKKKRGQSSLSCDAEDEDLYKLETLYRSFLDTHSLFEPAWEMPPFKDEGKKYVIVYPEILQDFEEYRLLLEQSPHVSFVNVPASPLDTALCRFTEYSNTRTELRKTALFIRSLCAPKDGSRPRFDWNDIALSIPDSENLIPYVMRELSLYNIPARLRSGKKLSLYPGGGLFTLIRNCYNESFSFDSVRALLTDPAFPWKDKTAVNQLIAFGIEHNCLCSYDNIDVWEQAFSKTPGEERARTLYRELKKYVKAVADASSFRKLREHYFAFAAAFFNPELFSKESDRIVSRCISELSSLAELEADYPEAARCSKVLDFFVSVLDSKDYLAQSSDRGVSVFSYRVAAAAPFKCHIVINASQNALNTVYRPLSFLNEAKRFDLRICDRDVSPLFVRLYAEHSALPLRAACSRESFSGYAIAHSVFDGCLSDAGIETESFKNADSADFFAAERSFLRGVSARPLFLHSVQKEGFFSWASLKAGEDVCVKSVLSSDIIRERILQYACDPVSGKIKVSASDLNSFYTCPLYWLFSRVLRIREYTADASLIDNVFIGTLYHEIIQRVLNTYKKKALPLLLEDGKIPSDTLFALKTFTREVIEGLPASCRLTNDVSPLTLESFRIQEASIVQKLTDFFYEFICWFSGFSVCDTEKALQLESENALFKGQIDCVLTNAADDSVCIVDFKTGKVPKFTKCIKLPEGTLSDFQLASYIRLYENAHGGAHAGAHTKIDTAAFFSIHKKELSVIVGSLVSPVTGKKKPYCSTRILPRDGFYADGVSSVDGTLQALEEAAQAYTASVLQADLPLFTDIRARRHFPDGSEVPYKTCADCAYKALCRTAYNLGRKS